MRYKDLNQGDSFQVVYPNGTRGPVLWRSSPHPRIDPDTKVMILGYGQKSRKRFQAEYRLNKFGAQ